MEFGDANAIHIQALNYLTGRYGLTKDDAKAFELLVQAEELGCAEAYNNVGTAFELGKGVDRDAKKAKYYYELAAIGGGCNGEAQSRSC